MDVGGRSRFFGQGDAQRTDNIYMLCDVWGKVTSLNRHLTIKGTLKVEYLRFKKVVETVECGGYL